MMNDLSDLWDAFGAIIDPISGRTLLQQGSLAEGALVEEGRSLQVTVTLPYPSHTVYKTLTAHFTQAMSAIVQSRAHPLQVSVALSIHIPIDQAQLSKTKPHQISNIVAISSAKGGVGKSTLAVSLAISLARQGARVGLLDADIYGPSIPHLLGVPTEKITLQEGLFQPYLTHNLQIMSIGFLVAEKSAMIWRGPMATKALDQLLHQTAWQKLDYLVIDMPPGTGDIHLSLAQKIPITGAVILSTPQPLAIADAQRGIHMFERVAIPIIGAIENMSFFQCPCCQHVVKMFSTENVAEQLHTTLLGQLPFDTTFNQASFVSVLAQVDHPITRLIDAIALKIALFIARKQEQTKRLFPQIILKKK